MTRYIAIAVCFLLVLSRTTVSSAQSHKDTLLIVPARDGMYFYHVVTPKQTLYSLSRDYHVDVHKLAAFNHLDIHTRLKVYQLLRIPLTGSNFNQSAAKPAASLQALYHKVTRGETLYHIGQLYNKVSLPLLRRWNHLQGNEVRAGQFVVVGWLGQGAATPPASVATSAKPEQKEAAKAPAPVTPKPEASAAVAAAPVSKPAAEAKEPAPAKEHASGNDDAFLNEVIAAENDRRTHAVPSPVAASPTASSAGPAADAFSVKVHSPAGQQAPPAKKPAPKEEAEAKTETVQVKESVPAAPAKAPPTDSFTLMLSRVTRNPEKAHTAKAVTGVPRGQTSAPGAPDIHTSSAIAATAKAAAAGPSESASAPPAPLPSEAPASSDSAASVIATSRFFSDYETQTAGETKTASRKGAAGWFHSNVKPGSGTYYALCNDLPRGTIVKVVNPLNHHSVLVKVLDVIPRQKENYNLIVKLSDAAMGDLGVSQPRFWCKIVYPQLKKEE